MKRYLVTVLLLSLLIMSCDPDGHVRGWQPVDLLSHGVAVSVLAPPSAEIRAGKTGSSLVDDLVIDGGEDYGVQLYFSSASTNDIAKLKNDQLQIVRSNRYFNKVVREEVAGFIYQNMIDSIPSYGFRLIKIQGDQELTFQTMMNGIYELEDVQLMYEAVK